EEYFENTEWKDKFTAWPDRTMDELRLPENPEELLELAEFWDVVEDGTVNGIGPDGKYPIYLQATTEELGTAGATETVKSDVEDVEKKVRSITNGRMADVVFEVTGNPAVIPWAIKLVKPQGRFVVLSSPRGPTQLDFHDEVNAPSRTIIGTHVTSQPEYETPYNQWTLKKNTELFFEFLKGGIIKVNHLISHKYPWFEAERAYRMLIENRAETMGVILDFREGQ
ncbi:unnamed protein product, partial [marine sediment metagenome]